MMPAISNVARIFIVSMMIGVALLVLVGVNMSASRIVSTSETATRVEDPVEQTLLSAAGDEVPPGGVVAGSFNQEFPGADPYAGIPVDEVGLPPLSEAEQEAVAREADRLADDLDARRNLWTPSRTLPIGTASVVCASTADLARTEAGPRPTAG